MLQLDANESALRGYMRQQDDDERRRNMIANRAVDLMATSAYAHDTGDNIIEALDECNHMQAEAIGLEARKGALHLGNAILARSFLYWHQMATDKATDEIDAEWDSCRCHGVGCRRCMEDEE